MSLQTKVVRIPVVIDEDNVDIRKIKYKALYKVMSEARYLGNMAIRYAIAFKLKNIPDEIDDKGKPVPLDTRIYRILAKEKKYLESGVMATLARNFAVKTFRNYDKDAWAGKKSLPTYRSLFVPFRHTETKVQEITKNGTAQFTIEPTGFKGKAWLSDDLIIEVADKGVDTNLSVDQRKLTLTSNFSWKDKGAAEVVRRIVSGEYKLSDSQIQKGVALL